MYQLPFLYFLYFVTARNNTAYHPMLLFQRCIVINNPTLAEILIRQSDPIGYRGTNSPEHWNKMTLIGMVLYILSILTVIIHIVLLNIKSLGPADYIEKDKFFTFHAVTINQCIVLHSSNIMLFINTFFMFFNMLTICIRQKDEEGRKTLIFVSLFFCILFLLGIALEVDSILELIV